MSRNVFFWIFLLKSKKNKNKINYNRDICSELAGQ